MIQENQSQNRFPLFRDDRCGPLVGVVVLGHTGPEFDSSRIFFP